MEHVTKQEEFQEVEIMQDFKNTVKNLCLHNIASFIVEESIAQYWVERWIFSILLLFLICGQFSLGY